jgi:hypothetical protein
VDYKYFSVKFGVAYPLETVIISKYRVLSDTLLMDAPKPKKLLDRVRDTLRVKHYAHSTEEAYIHVSLGVTSPTPKPRIVTESA